MRGLGFRHKVSNGLANKLLADYLSVVLAFAVQRYRSTPSTRGGASGISEKHHHFGGKNEILGATQEVINVKSTALIYCLEIVVLS